jgi:hypothetical protein
MSTDHLYVTFNEPRGKLCPRSHKIFTARDRPFARQVRQWGHFSAAYRDIIIFSDSLMNKVSTFFPDFPRGKAIPLERCHLTTGFWIFRTTESECEWYWQSRRWVSLRGYAVYIKLLPYRPHPQTVPKFHSTIAEIPSLFMQLNQT